MKTRDLEEYSKKINGNLYFDYSIKKLNWFNIGGKTKIFFKPETLKELSEFLKIFNKRGKVTVIGAGSNILFSDDLYDGVIINPAAFTHSSIAILDSLRSVNKPKIEIHLSNIYSREEYRKKSITSEGVDGLICGFGENSYILGIEAIAKLIYK